MTRYSIKRLFYDTHDSELMQLLEHVYVLIEVIAIA